MKAASIKFKTVEEYFSTLPPTQKKFLQDLRKMIKKAAPQAEELISYNMPAFRFHGMLVYYAAYKAHIGFYPVSSAIKIFKNELAGYAGGKGTIRFPLDKPIPADLINKIVAFRVKENMEKEKVKKITKSKINREKIL